MDENILKTINSRYPGLITEIYQLVVDDRCPCKIFSGEYVPKKSKCSHVFCNNSICSKCIDIKCIVCKSYVCPNHRHRCDSCNTYMCSACSMVYLPVCGFCSNRICLKCNSDKYFCKMCK